MYNGTKLTARFVTSQQMEDLKQFIIILMVFIISFGIAQQAVLFPGPQFARGKNFWTVIRGIVDWPYWQMYGELFLDEIQGNFHSLIFLELSGALQSPRILIDTFLC